ncbi:MAG: hypothetical protein Q9180_007812 [Flavoplaca navasiana]
MSIKSGATSLDYTTPRKNIKRERLESELSDLSSWSDAFKRPILSSDSPGSPTIPPGTTNSSNQGTADPSDTYDDPDAPVSRRTRFSPRTRFSQTTRPRLYDKLYNKSAPLQQPTRPHKPTSGCSDKAAPERSPDLDMEFLTDRITALKERVASLEHENEDLKTLNQELETKYKVLAEKVAGLADLLPREA